MVIFAVLRLPRTAAFNFVLNAAIVGIRIGPDSKSSTIFS